LGGGWKFNHDGRFLRKDNGYDKFDVLRRQVDWRLEKEGRLLSGGEKVSESSNDGVDSRIVPCSDSDDSSSNSSSRSIGSFLDDEKESIFDFLVIEENVNAYLYGTGETIRVIRASYILTTVCQYSTFQMPCIACISTKSLNRLIQSSQLSYYRIAVHNNTAFDTSKYSCLHHFAHYCSISSIDHSIQ
jgi:hypothetical protein